MPDTLNIGETIEVEVTVRNLGTTPVYMVSINDTIPEGWTLIEGQTYGFRELVEPGEELKVRYVIRADNPKNESLPAASIELILGGWQLKFSTNKLILRIGLKVFIRLLTAYNKTLPSATIEIIDEKIGVTYNLTAMNGNVEWNGYVGVFKIKVYYEGHIVLSDKFLITRESNSLELITSVYEAKIMVLDALGRPLKGADVSFESSKGYTQKLVTDMSGMVSAELLPGSVYTVRISHGGLTYTYVIVVDKNIQLYKLNLPVIGLDGASLDVSQLLLALTILTGLIGSISILRLKVAAPLRPRRRKARKKR